MKHWLVLIRCKQSDFLPFHVEVTAPDKEGAKIAVKEDSRYSKVIIERVKRRWIW